MPQCEDFIVQSSEILTSMGLRPSRRRRWELVRSWAVYCKREETKAEDEGEDERGPRGGCGENGGSERRVRRMGVDRLLYSWAQLCTVNSLIRGPKLCPKLSY